MLRILKKIIPTPIFEFFQPAYHYFWAVLGAIVYNSPSKKLVVIGVTGTKGKSTTAEIMNSILEAAGYRTALASTVRFKIGDHEERNLHKMTMPGRLFMQRFLRDALKAGCSHAILEMTSEGAKQYRHKFVYLDALIFTNLAPEHIESHGSYDKYVQAKLSIAKELGKPMKKVWPNEALRRMTQGGNEETPARFELRSKSGRRGLFEGAFPVLIINTDDQEAEKFLALNIKNKISYSLHDATAIQTNEKGSSFQIGKVVFHSTLPGIFNVYNILGAVTLAQYMDLPLEIIKRGVENLEFIRGRMEKIKVYPDSKAGREGQNFDVVVDYAHTPDSLKAVYEAYKGFRKICVLGNTGGGRDTWKRKVMGEIADEYCEQIILTDEDSYDEDPLAIVTEMKKGISQKPFEIILDRRAAISKALKLAQETKNSAVLVTGKGTDPYIMGPRGSKLPWDDAEVTREELQKLKENA